MGVVWWTIKAGLTESGPTLQPSFLDFVYSHSAYCKDSLPSSHYGNYNLQSNLLCFTKKCLFKIPLSIIKRAIELQNTIIIARLGGALAH